MNAPYKICVVGLGLHGLGLIERLVSNPAQWQLVAVVDSSVAAYARFQARYNQYGIPFFRSVTEAIRAREVDAVVVATTAPSHVAICRQLIQSGYERPILVEKPISNSLLAARSLEQMTRETNWPGEIAVGFYRRTSDIYEQVDKVVREETFGMLRRIEFSRAGKLSMKGSHYMDLANWLARSTPVEMTCQLESTSKVDHRGAFYFDPAPEAEIQYANGIVFAMDMTSHAQYKPGMSFQFDHGEVFVDEEELNVQISGEDVEYAYQSPEADWKKRHYSWFENTLVSLIEAKGYKPCSLPEAILCLEEIVGAFESSALRGKPITFPIDSLDHLDPLRIA